MIGRQVSGVMSALRGRADWEEAFPLGPVAMTRAAIILLATLPAYGVIAYGVEAARADILGTDIRQIPWPAFAVVALLYSLAFPLVATVLGAAFGKIGRIRRWIVVRHWAVLILAWAMAGLWVLTRLGLPVALANGALFVAMFGVLALDIRLAQVAGRFGLGAATLIGSVISTLGLTLLLSGLLFYLGG